MEELMIGQILEPFGLSDIKEDLSERIRFIISKGHDEFKSTILVIHFYTKDDSVLCEALKAKAVNVFTTKKVFGK